MKNLSLQFFSVRSAFFPLRFLFRKIKKKLNKEYDWRKGWHNDDVIILFSRYIVLGVNEAKKNHKTSTPQEYGCVQLTKHKDIDSCWLLHAHLTKPRVMYMLFLCFLYLSFLLFDWKIKKKKSHWLFINSCRKQLSLEKLFIVLAVLCVFLQKKVFEEWKWKSRV